MGINPGESIFDDEEEEQEAEGKLFALIIHQPKEPMQFSIGFFKFRSIAMELVDEANCESSFQITELDLEQSEFVLKWGVEPIEFKISRKEVLGLVEVE